MKKPSLSAKIIRSISILVIALVVVFISAFLEKNSAHISAEIKQPVKIGEKIQVPIFIATGNNTINAAEIYLNFDPNKLQIIEVSKNNSFFQLWIKDEPKFSNEKGEISFAGGLPQPGFKGKGQVGEITLVIQQSGRNEISFDSKTRILLNDGKGTALPLDLKPIKINSHD